MRYKIFGFERFYAYTDGRRNSSLYVRQDLSSNTSKSKIYDTKYIDKERATRYSKLTEVNNSYIDVLYQDDTETIYIRV